MKVQHQQLKGTKSLAWFLLLVFSTGLFNSTVVFAGGPTQPEVHGFTPIGVSDMVDPFTGDFTYNIPLMDIDGYPINIAYNSGITMDQEASWVGLGWNLNMGAIVRSMRGVPDEFQGDSIVNINNRKPTRDISLSMDVPFEVFGFDLTSVAGMGNVSVGMNVNHSNYTGTNVGFDFGTSVNFGSSNDMGWGGNLKFSGSSDNGAGVSANTSLSVKNRKDDKGNKKANYSIGLGGGYNSRAGLQSLSFNANLERSKTRDTKIARMVTKRLDKGIAPSFDLGLASYTPSASPSMESFGFSGNFSTSTTIYGSDVQFNIGFTINNQKIAESEKHKYVPAFGYFNLEKGQNKPYALLDFNRDNEGSFTKYTPNLPSAFLTSDIFSINAQGVSGSFKASRSDVGFVFDPISRSISDNVNIGLEIGAGGLLDFGADLQYNNTNAKNGPWIGNENNAQDAVKFENASGINETYALKEANELSVDNDPFVTISFPASTLQTLDLKGTGLFPRLEDEINGNAITLNNRTERQKRNNVLSYLTIGEVRAGLGLENLHPQIYAENRSHHIGEMTQLGTDGRRYVFGIPAYNHIQRDFTFATGNGLNNLNGIFPSDDFEGLLDLGNNFNSIVTQNNNKGIDNYYSEEITPAYAHSFLLSAVLSDDYVDSDITKGPSKDDQGTYVKFGYTKLENVKWRSPMQANTVFHGRGTKTDKTDDKSSITYGEKDVWYVSIVETKNYVAVFELEDRDDAKSVAGYQGGLTGIPAGKSLKSITLYSRPDYEAHINNLAQATPIQKVHFVYDYSLCPGYPGNANGGGKLTLTEIYFTYQGSYKLKRSSYKFDYAYNEEYNMKAVDRWGNYKPTGSGNAENINSLMTNADNPYTLQNAALTDQHVQAWTLQQIKLPSGGTIKVVYESDDYAYVQHKRACEMMPICAVSDKHENMKTAGLGGAFVLDSVAGHNTVKNNECRSVYVKMKPGFNNVADYIDVSEPVYFRTLTEMYPESNDQNRFEYIGSYARVESATMVTNGGINYLKIDFKPEKLLDNGNEKFSPITKSGLLFGRMNLSRNFMGLTANEPSGTSESDILDFSNSVVDALASFAEMFTGPNLPLYNAGKCHKIVLNKSFIRLKEPTKHKLGGGLRVKKILISDNWDSMIEGGNPAQNDYTYGQEFSYNLPDGSSSGVASYEPSIGSDENPLHKPYFYEEKFRLAPDNELYLEEPIMESQFPSPTVGYSYVTIKDISRTNVSRTATGKVVKEFYTAKDFPTFVHRSSIDPKSAKSFLPLFPKYQFLSASQGFEIETNDMHGKPKSETIYPENSTNPISQVEYKYAMDPITYEGAQCHRLSNKVTVINPDGTNSNAQFGVRVETVADFKENKTRSIGGSINVNSNSMMAGPWYLFIPTLWPKMSVNTSTLRTASLSKTTERFGLLNTTVAKKDGSIVETNNLAYDAITGEVLVTQTTTDFNDKIYSVNYPAHWKYEQMGPAYKNIGYKLIGYPIANDGFVPVPANLNHFVEGDEVKVISPSFSGAKKGWVLQVTATGIRLVDKSGNPISGTNSTITVIRSGRRNKQATSIASITTISNPISSIQSGVFNNVVNAGSVEFANDWRTYCNCFTGERANFISTNPFISNNKGVWRPIKSYTYLTNRTQTNFNENTNIRRDGVFESFSPYYRFINGKLNTFKAGWTYVSEVTEFSPSGTTLETRDALGRYSTSLQGFSGTLTTAVAANSKITQVLEGSFEDAQFTNCTDQGFFKDIPSQNLSTTQAHTGSNSLHVGSNQFLEVGVQNLNCTVSTICDIGITALSANTYQVEGCTGDCNATYTTISGNGSAVLNSNGVLTISNTTLNNGYLEMMVTVTSKLCTIQIKVSSIPPSNSSLDIEVLNQTSNY